MNAFSRRIILAVVLLIALMGVIFLIGSRRVLPAPRVNGIGSGGSIVSGSRGPFILVFDQPVDRQSLETRFAVEPLTGGRFIWKDDRQVSFWPEKPLSAGLSYRLRIGEGVLGKQGAALGEELVWQIMVRTPGVVYISPSQAPELWQVTEMGRDPLQLTETGGRLYDYQVSADGSRIVYSAGNDKNGKDLWELRLPEGSRELLIDCGPDWCTGAAYAPGLDRIAYSRRVFSGLSGSAPGAPRLWVLRTDTGETDVLFIDPNIGGQAADWSPDGRYLAFVDEISEGVRVVDFQVDEDFFLPTGPGAAFSWSPESSAIFITRAETTSAFPYVLIYRVDVSTQEAILWTVGDTADYSAPVLSPDGEWAAVARRAIDGVPGKQLWLATRGGSLKQAITDDPLASHASYHWDPGGSFLLYQRLKVGGSANHPDVMVWDRLNSEYRTVAKDAFLPQWVP